MPPKGKTALKSSTRGKASASQDKAKVSKVVSKLSNAHTATGNRSRSKQQEHVDDELDDDLQLGRDQEEEQEQQQSSASGSESDAESQQDSEPDQDDIPVTAAPGRLKTSRAKKAGDNQTIGKRNYAELLAGHVDEATLRSMYRTLPGQRLVERSQCQQQLLDQAPLWHLLLRSGFNVLLHGLGSKRGILQDVAENHLVDGAVITCNGFVKTLTAHKVIAAAAGALLQRSCRSTSSTELLSLIRKEAEEWPDRRVYVVLHNIDGPGLRNESDQAMLAHMAACRNVHLIASIDHVNAPLMWSTAVAAQFRWAWFTAHTYSPHIAETMDKPSVLLGSYQRSRQRGAGAVLRSMPDNTRDVFALLVNAQVDDPELEGLDFKHVFRMCREQFLLTSETALRSALTEFIDHELLATRQSSDGGGELLYVPMDAAGLAKVQAELEAIKAEAAATQN